MSDVFGPATLAATQGFSAFQTFLPRLSEVRKSDPVNDPDIIGDVRMGEVAAMATTLGIGAISSSLSRSPIPMYAALFICIVLICVYEAALRGDRPFTPKNEEAVIRNA